MRKLLQVLVFVPAAIGCGTDVSVIEGPFTATADLTAVVNPGKIEFVDSTLYLSGQVNRGSFVAGDLQGTATVTVNAEVDFRTGSGRGDGTFIFSITGVKGESVAGDWEGEFSGKITGPLLSGDLSGTGNGDLAGFRIEGTFNRSLVSGTEFTLKGTITRFLTNPSFRAI